MSENHEDKIKRDSGINKKNSSNLLMECLNMDLNKTDSVNVFVFFLFLSIANVYNALGSKLKIF